LGSESRRRMEETTLSCDLERAIICASWGNVWDDAMDLGSHGVSPVRLGFDCEQGEQR
jgi:hypothetical protein